MWKLKQGDWGSSGQGMDRTNNTKVNKRLDNANMKGKEGGLQSSSNLEGKKKRGIMSTPRLGGKGS